MQPGIVLIIGLMLSGLSSNYRLKADTFLFIDERDYSKPEVKKPPCVESYIVVDFHVNLPSHQAARNQPQSQEERLAWARTPPVYALSSISLDDDVEPKPTVHPGFNPQAQERLGKMSLQQAYNYCHQHYGCLSKPENRHRIINTYPLHQFSTFREVMKSLPDYETEMFDLAARINNVDDPSVREEVKYVQGFSKREFEKYIHEAVNEITIKQRLEYGFSDKLLVLERPYVYEPAPDSTSLSRTKRGYFEQFSSDDFRYYFNGSNLGAAPGNELKNRITRMYGLYQYDAFRDYLRGFPDYETQMQSLHNQIHNDQALSKKLQSVEGFGGRDAFVRQISRDTKQATQQRCDREATEQKIYQEQRELKKRYTPIYQAAHDELIVSRVEYHEITTAQGTQAYYAAEYCSRLEQQLAGGRCDDIAPLGSQYRYYIEMRVQALKKTIADPTLRVAQAVNVSDDTYPIAQERGSIELLEEFSGTPLACSLHLEANRLYQLMCEKELVFGGDQQFRFDLTMTTLEASFIYNRMGYPDFASCIIDLVWLHDRCAWNQIKEGIFETGEIIQKGRLNPIAQVSAIHDATGYILGNVSGMITSKAAFELGYTDTDASYQVFKKNSIAMADAFFSQYKPQQIVKTATVYWTVTAINFIALNLVLPFAATCVFSGMLSLIELYAFYHPGLQKLALIKKCADAATKAAQASNAVTNAGKNLGKLATKHVAKQAKKPHLFPKASKALQSQQALVQQGCMTIEQQAEMLVQLMNKINAMRTATEIFLQHAQGVQPLLATNVAIGRALSLMEDATNQVTPPNGVSDQSRQAATIGQNPAQQNIQPATQTPASQTPTVPAKPTVTMEVRAAYEKQFYPLTKQVYALQKNAATQQYLDPSLFNLPITIDANHQFFPKFEKDKRNGLKLSGMHHDYNNEILPQFGCTSQIIDQFADGSYEAIVSKDGFSFEPKTFFDSTKTRQEIINLIIEALNCPQEPAYLTPNNRWSITGKTKSNLLIKIYLDQNGQVTTAYPVTLSQHTQ